MKNLTGLIFLFYACLLHSQISVNQSIISFQKKYAPLFGKESGIVAMDFFKTYTYGQSDTIYKFKLTIVNKKIEETGGSVGTAISSGGFLALGLTNSYTINKENKSIELSQSEFSTFFENVNKVFVLSGNPNNKGKSIYTYEKNGLIFGAQFDEKKEEELSYFLELDGAIYPLPKLDFIEIVTKMKNIYKMWNQSPTP